MNRLILLLPGLLASQAFGLVVIDDFSTGDLALSRKAGTDLQFAAGSMVGGDRASIIEVAANPFNANYESVVAGGYWMVSSGPGVRGRAASLWGYKPDPMNPLAVLTDDMNLDLVSENKFQIGVAFNDVPVTLRLQVGSNGASQTSGPIAVGTVGALTIYEVDFSQFAGINFADVDQIALEIDGSVASDTVIDYINAVPEPATLAALGVGLAALVSRRRHR